VLGRPVYDHKSSTFKFACFNSDSVAKEAYIPFNFRIGATISITEDQDPSTHKLHLFLNSHEAWSTDDNNDLLLLTKHFKKNLL
jgi:hypothetical protein